MKSIKAINILLALACALLFAITLVAGVFAWPWWIVSALSLAGYFFFNHTLRCPWCGGTLDQGKLLRSLKKGVYTCPSCSGQILLEKPSKRG